MSREIEAHVPRRRRGLNRLEDVIVVRPISMNHGEGAVGVRRERVTRGRIEPGAVDARSDWYRRNDFPRAGRSRSILPPADR